MVDPRYEGDPNHPGLHTEPDGTLPTSRPPGTPELVVDGADALTWNDGVLTVRVRNTSELDAWFDDRQVVPAGATKVIQLRVPAAEPPDGGVRFTLAWNSEYLGEVDWSAEFELRLDGSMHPRRWAHGAKWMH